VRDSHVSAACEHDKIGQSPAAQDGHFMPLRSGLDERL
jgi:hypothetical protein